VGAGTSAGTYGRMGNLRQVCHGQGQHHHFQPLAGRRKQVKFLALNEPQQAMHVGVHSN